MKLKLLFSTFLIAAITFYSCTEENITPENTLETIEDVFKETEINNFNLSDEKIQQLVVEMNTEMPEKEQISVLERFAALNVNDLDKFNTIALEFNQKRAEELQLEQGAELKNNLESSIEMYHDFNKKSIELYGLPMHRISDEEFEIIKKMYSNSFNESKGAWCPLDGGPLWNKGSGSTKRGDDQQWAGGNDDYFCDIRVNYQYTSRRKVKGLTPMGNFVILGYGNKLSGRYTSSAVYTYVGFVRGWSHCIPVIDIAVSY